MMRSLKVISLGVELSINQEICLPWVGKPSMLNPGHWEEIMAVGSAVALADARGVDASGRVVGSCGNTDASVAVLSGAGASPSLS